MSESLEIYAAAAEAVSSQYPVTIPLTGAFLCVDPDCSMVSNTAQKCPVCHSSVLPLSGIVNQTAKALPPEVAEDDLALPAQRLSSTMGVEDFFAK